MTRLTDSERRHKWSDPADCVPPTLFDGATFSPAHDGERLTKQCAAVFALMRDGRWRTLAQIAESVTASEASVSARLRDFRKARFGGHRVDRRRVEGTPGLWEYRVEVNRGAR